MYKPRKVVEDLISGVVEDVRNFPIHLDYPERAFRNIYALDWKDERAKQGMPVK